MLMKIFFFFLLICFSNSQDIQDLLSQPGNKVISLSDKKYEQAIAKNELLVVVFYVPWCRKCRKFFPEYIKVSQYFQMLNEKIVFSAIDTNRFNKMSNKYSVRSLPSIMLFYNYGDVYATYNGPMEEDAIEKWIQMKINPPMKLETEENINNFLKDNTRCSIYFGNNKKEILEYRKMRFVLDVLPFAMVDDKEIINKYGYNPDSGTVVLYKKFDEGKNEIKNFNYQNLEQFFSLNIYPKVMKLSKEVIDNKLFSSKIPTLILFANENSPHWNEYNETLYKVFYEVNKDNKNKLRILLTDITDEKTQSVADYLYISKKDFPFILLFDTKNAKPKKVYDDPMCSADTSLENSVGINKYLMDKSQALNLENILKFVSKYESNKIAPYVKSQDIPLNNTATCKTLVGKNFRKEVLENDKDILVLFYKKGVCQIKDCEAFYEGYEKTAEEEKHDNKNLIFAKIDLGENEVEGMSIGKFPKIFLYPGRKKFEWPEEYIGDWTFKDIMMFAVAYASNKVTYDPNKDLITDL